MAHRNTQGFALAHDSHAANPHQGEECRNAKEVRPLRHNPAEQCQQAHEPDCCQNPLSRLRQNINHPFNIVTGTLASAGADILFAAGNCGANCPDSRCQNVVTNTITGANAHPAVLTVAGCDTTGARVGYSSQGPAIAGMGANKPDIAAHTHFLGSTAFGAAEPDSGTSAACPVAAGCVAALRTKLPFKQVATAQVFAALRQTASAAGAPGWNADYGHGIIQPDPAGLQLGV